MKIMKITVRGISQKLSKQSRVPVYYIRDWLISTLDFGAFDLFFAGLGKNRMYAHEPVLTSSEKQKLGTKSILS